MKATHIALLFAVLATATFGQTALQGTSGGFFLRPENTNCILQILYNVYSDKAVIGQQNKPSKVQPAQPLPDGCGGNAKNFVFTSFFEGEQLSSSDALVPVAPTDGSNIYNATLNLQTITQNNGTGCVLLPQNSRAGLAQYVCSFTYEGIPIYLALWYNPNIGFATSDYSDVNGQAWLITPQNTMTTGASSLVYGVNTSFPNISANLYSYCGSTSNVINSLDRLVSVTSSSDLSAALGTMKVAYTLVKKNNSTDYLTVPSTSEASVFTPGSGNGCWSLAMNYGAFLPNMDYCADGCKISFVLTNSDGRIYVLETSGVQTKANGNLRA